MALTINLWIIFLQFPGTKLHLWSQEESSGRLPNSSPDPQLDASIKTCFGCKLPNNWPSRRSFGNVETVDPPLWAVVSRINHLDVRLWLPQDPPQKIFATLVIPRRSSLFGERTLEDVLPLTPCLMRTLQTQIAPMGHSIAVLPSTGPYLAILPLISGFTPWNKFGALMASISLFMTIDFWQCLWSSWFLMLEQMCQSTS